MTIVTLFLSLAVVIIAALQWRIADNKLRLDLFDRRYKVYDATRKFLAVIIRDAAFTQSQLVELSIGTSVELNSPQTITAMTDIRSTMAAKAVLAIGMMTALLLTGCGKKHTPQYVHIGPDSLPTKSYERGPEERFNRSDYVIKLKQMTSFYDVPGEAGYFMNGEDYGFGALSFLLTETQPGGGPPLHMHDSEESHIVLHGQVEYVIGDRRFTVEGPYVARVPAGVPHTFRNAGTEPFNLIAVFPDKHLSYKELGKNPLTKPAK